MKTLANHKFQEGITYNEVIQNFPQVEFAFSAVYRVMSVFVICSGELNPMVSPTESSGVAGMGLPHLLVALGESQGQAAPVGVRVGPAAADW